MNYTTIRPSSNLDDRENMHQTTKQATKHGNNNLSTEHGDCRLSTEYGDFSLSTEHEPISILLGEIAPVESLKAA